ncbi:putative ABC transporter ATP-binding protein [Geobacter sp. OR-1]|uniref:ABC transporter ATP-binding protein n=1 Tax=Geobacter sp. OR-1 TaxID=1266765 RepID=UPI0005436352|nr:ABC transporter ATP-binding protein [Geobacter sp. OR-1]GAM10269.1 putative ABC transporter ATP-binding protein [Geobacter sp. OR-1]
MATSAPLLDVQGVTIQYKTAEQLVTATWQVGFQVDRTDRLVLLGPSGCGKSTILKAVGGYLTPADGRITLDGRTISGPGPDRMMVFQETDQLLPWKTVRQNVAFALTASRKASQNEADEQAMAAIRTVKLEKFADAYPHTLSGGMKQRVAIARCLAMKPEIVLMDEPFAALDALTRQQMQEELLELWNRSKFTMIFVTHSIEEAILLGNRIVLLSPHPGQVKEILDVDLDDPANRFHGRFNDLRDTIHRVLFHDLGDYVI